MTFGKTEVIRTPLSEQVASSLRKHVSCSRAPGCKLPSTGDLAAEFGVSVPTVRKALASLVEEGLLYVKKGSGHFLSNRISDSAPVGLLYDLNLGESMSTCQRVRTLLNYQKTMAEFGRDSRFYLGTKPHGDRSVDLSATAILSDLEAGRLSGVLDLSGRPSPELTAMARQVNVPLLGTGRYYQFGVCLDFEAFLRKALQIVRRNGRRKVAFCAMQYLHPDKAADADEVQRILREEGFEFSVSWIREDWHSTMKGGGWESFQDIWRTPGEKPDALVLGSPAFADEVDLAMRDIGLQHPDNIFVVSAAVKNGIMDLQYPWPTVDADLMQHARALCEMMHLSIIGEEIDQRMRKLDVWSENNGVDRVACQAGQSMSKVFGKDELVTK